MNIQGFPHSYGQSYTQTKTRGSHSHLMGVQQDLLTRQGKKMPFGAQDAASDSKSPPRRTTLKEGPEGGGVKTYEKVSEETGIPVDKLIEQSRENQKRYEEGKKPRRSIFP